MTERKPAGMSPESWAEQQIVDAMERGELDSPAQAGRPLDLSDRSEDWWLKRKLAEERLDLPRSLQLRADRDAFRASFTELPTEHVVRERAERLNARIRYANSHGITGPPVAMMPMDVEKVVERWRAARDGGSDADAQDTTADA